MENYLCLIIPQKNTNNFPIFSDIPIFHAKIKIYRCQCHCTKNECVHPYLFCTPRQGAGDEALDTGPAPTW